MSQHSKLREELVKAMPGYSWTVHKGKAKDIVVIATGIQSAGSNRLSTLQVERREVDGVVMYTARSAGYGRRAPWLHTASDGTLARALRSLQEHYERTASQYSNHANALQFGRVEPKTNGGAA